MAPRCKRQLQGRAKSNRALLGQVTGRIGLPCTVSVPNRSADRAALLSGWKECVDVRRLMYQTLICRIDRQGGDDQPCRFAAPIHPQLVESAANSLVDGVRADPELCGNFLAVVMLVDQQQAFDLPRAKPRH